MPNPTVCLRNPVKFIDEGQNRVALVTFEIHGLNQDPSYNELGLVGVQVPATRQDESTYQLKIRAARVLAEDFARLHDKLISQGYFVEVCDK